MALSALIQWDVRTGGNDSNGGGFVTTAGGTDFSQQNSPNSSGTLGTATGTTAFSDAGHSFTSTEAGNLIQIASGSGFTPGFYQVISVAGGIATLDRSPGTGTVAVWALGGSLLTIAKALANAVSCSAVTASNGSGNTVWVKSGTYTLTATITIPAINGLTIQGYQTTHGDFTGTRPLVTTATNSTNLFLSGGGHVGLVMSNLSMSNTASTRLVGISANTGGFSQGITIYNCLFDGFTTAVKGPYSGAYYFDYLVMVGCEVKNCTGTGAIWHDANTFLFGCHLHGNTGAGFYIDNTLNSVGSQSTVTPIFVNTIFSGNQDGILSSPGADGYMLVCTNCVFYNQSRDGIRFTGNIRSILHAVNCIFDTNAGWAVNATGYQLNALFALNNAFYSNTSGKYNGAPATSIGDITLSGDPFVSAGTNFALNATSGAGAACKAAGFPGVIPNAGTGNLDVGALQSAGSTSTTLNVIESNSPVIIAGEWGTAGY